MRLHRCSGLWGPADCRLCGSCTPLGIQNDACGHGPGLWMHGEAVGDPSPAVGLGLQLLPPTPAGFPDRCGQPALPTWASAPITIDAQCLQLGVIWGLTSPRTGFAGQPAVHTEGLGRAQEHSAGGGPSWTHPTPCVSCPGPLPLCQPRHHGLPMPSATGVPGCGHVPGGLLSSGSMACKARKSVGPSLPALGRPQEVGSLVSRTAHCWPARAPACASAAGTRPCSLY